MKNNIKRSDHILRKMHEEKIVKTLPSKEMAEVRTAIATLNTFPVGPAFTNSVATTYFGVGFCQELSQRFVFEYIKEYKLQNLGLIFLLGETGNNHALVYIGNIKANDNLFIGRGNHDGTVNSKASMPLSKFIKENSDLVYADPTLNTTLTSVNIARLEEYCKRCGITQVIAIRDYSNTLNMWQSVDIVATNAQKLAIQTQIKLKDLYSHIMLVRSTLSAEGFMEHPSISEDPQKEINCPQNKASTLLIKKGLFYCDTKGFNEFQKEVNEIDAKIKNIITLSV